MNRHIIFVARDWSTPLSPLLDDDSFLVDDGNMSSSCRELMETGNIILSFVSLQCRLISRRRIRLIGNDKRDKFVQHSGNFL